MEWIANMPGPAFLGFYAVVILAVLAVAYLAIRSSFGGGGADPMVPVLPNPYEMAYMRGGEREIGKLVLIELARRGYIEERTDSAGGGGRAYLRQAENPPQTHELAGPHRQIFELVGRQDQPVARLMKNKAFAAAIEEITSGFLPRLREEGLVVGDFQRAKVLFLAAVAITGLGGYKLADALLEGRSNVIFLIVFLILGLIALWHAVSPRLTWRGNKYFRSTQDVFRYETADATLDPGGTESNRMLLHVGLFGAPILFGTAASGYATMLGLDPKSRYSDSGCGSGCGSSTSCSGDGDGGGGCGSGCGGCGD